LLPAKTSSSSTPLQTLDIQILSRASQFAPSSLGPLRPCCAELGPEPDGARLLVPDSCLRRAVPPNAFSSSSLTGPSPPPPPLAVFV
jgi:hypothetical protein